MHSLIPVILLGISRVTRAILFLISCLDKLENFKVEAVPAVNPIRLCMGLKFVVETFLVLQAKMLAGRSSSHFLYSSSLHFLILPSSNPLVRSSWPVVWGW